MKNKLTIVGPEASHNDETSQNVSQVNIESLMLMAKYDDDFRDLLLNDRERAMAESGITFTPSEKMLLTHVGKEKLAQTIEEFSVPGITKKSLSNWRAAAAVLVLITTVLLGIPACTPGVYNNWGTKSGNQRTDGWLDDNTFFVIILNTEEKILRKFEANQPII